MRPSQIEYKLEQQQLRAQARRALRQSIEDELYDRAQLVAVVPLQAVLRRFCAMRTHHSYLQQEVARGTQAVAEARAGHRLQCHIRRMLAMASWAYARWACIVLQSAARRMVCMIPYERFRKSQADIAATIAEIRAADPYFPPLTPPKSSHANRKKTRETPDAEEPRYGLLITEKPDNSKRRATCELPMLVARMDTPVRKLRDPNAGRSQASSRTNSHPSTRNATPVAHVRTSSEAPVRRQSVAQSQSRMVKRVVQAFQEPTKKNALPLPVYDPVKAGARLQARAQARAKQQTQRMQEEAASRTSDMSKFQEAEMFNRESLAAARKSKGPEHPETLLIARNLVASLSLQGKFAEAEVIEREVLAIRRKVLGAEHLDTLTCAGNLAALLSCQGKVSEANTMNRDVLAIRRRLSNTVGGRSAVAVS